MTMRIQELGGPDFERLTRGYDEDTGFDAIIAIHDTKEGPALGGCRINDYYTLTEHMADAMRLSRTMTSKNKAAGLPRGGGKMVVNTKGPLSVEQAASLGVFVDFINKDGHIYTTGGDMNCGERELSMISQHTRHCYYNPYGLSNSGETTAYGVYTAISHLVGRGNAVNIEGVGKVGSSLARMLKDDGYRVRVTDIQKDLARELAFEEGYQYCEPDEIRFMDGVYAPCATGRTVDLNFALNSKAKWVIGGANNQLHTDEVLDDLKFSEIMYVPDYIANMGGVIHIYFDMVKGYTAPTGIEDPGVINQIKERILGCPTINKLKEDYDATINV